MINALIIYMQQFEPTPEARKIYDQIMEALRKNQKRGENDSELDEMVTKQALDRVMSYVADGILSLPPKKRGVAFQVERKLLEEFYWHFYAALEQVKGKK